MIFYSNFCTYSKEVINNISKTPINDKIIYVCVDDENIKLPDFITAVPTIYLVNEKQIVVDEDITAWIKDKLSKYSKAEESKNEVQAYYGATGDSFGLSFSNIDNSETKPFISSFTYLGEEQKITTPDGENNGSNGSNNSNNYSVKSGLSKEMENLQKQRNQTFQMISRT